MNLGGAGERVVCPRTKEDKSRFFASSHCLTASFRTMSTHRNMGEASASIPGAGHLRGHATFVCVSVQNLRIAAKVALGPVVCCIEQCTTQSMDWHVDSGLGRFHSFARIAPSLTY